MKPQGTYDATYSRRVQLRNRLLKKYAETHPNVARIRGAARKQLLDKLEAEHIRPRVWRWTFDHQLGTQDRQAFALYKAAVKLRAQQLRRSRHHDIARMLERHITALVDVVPREASCYYPREWAEISRALRPQGSNPKTPRARELYAIYQRIRSQHQVEEV